MPDTGKASSSGLPTQKNPEAESAELARNEEALLSKQSVTEILAAALKLAGQPLTKRKTQKTASSPPPASSSSGDDEEDEEEDAEPPAPSKKAKSKTSPRTEGSSGRKAKTPAPKKAPPSVSLNKKKLAALEKAQRQVADRISALVKDLE